MEQNDPETIVQCFNGHLPERVCSDRDMGVHIMLAGFFSLLLRRKSALFLLVFAGGLLCAGFPPWGSGSQAWGDIYGFQDENGVMHFSNVPQDGRFRFLLKEKKRKSPKSLYESRRKGYDNLIWKIAKEKGVDPHLVRAVVEVESNFNHRAVSKKGARGLMQIMPATGKSLGLVDPFHPEENLAAGIRYLKGLIEKYSGKLPLALAAYNAGENAVDRYQGIPPYPETRGYVLKVMKIYEKRSGKGPGR